MLYIIKNRMPLKVKLQYIHKSIKRGFFKSESDWDNHYQQEYDEITLDYLKKFNPEEYKVALERLSFIGSDNDTLRSLLGFIIYGGLKSIFLLAIVTPVVIVHHVASESMHSLYNLLNIFINVISKIFKAFAANENPEKSILLNNKADYISRAKKEIRAHPLNDRHISFELPEANNTNAANTKHIVKSSEDKRRISGMLYRMRLKLNYGKSESLKSMQEEDSIPTLQQYRESKCSPRLLLTDGDSLILTGRIGWKF